MTIRIFGLALGLMAVLAIPAASEEARGRTWRFGWFGYLSEEPAYFALREDTLVNPRSRVLTFPEWENRITGNINATLEQTPAKLVGKVRPTVESTSTSTDLSVPVDDLYLDVRVFQRAFLTLGVKNYREGVGLSFNPTDFLAEKKTQDFTKREEERRADREGNLVAGLDVFFKNATLSAILAPSVDGIQDEKTRALFRLSMLVEAAKLDASLSYFVADRPGLGLNLSETVGEQLEVHAEVAGRWGSPRKQVRKIQDAIDNVRSALFDVRDPPDGDKVFTELVVGGNYTFSDGTSLIGEYYFVQDGYSARQWDRVLEFIEFSRSSFLEGTFGSLPGGNLLEANRLLTFRRLRQHYLFARVHNAGLLEQFDGAISFLLNAEDRSFAIVPIVDFTGFKNLRLGVHATILEGGDRSEFGLSPFSARVGLVLRYLF